MIYLKQSADDAAVGALRHVPLAEKTAVRLERALLTHAPELRRRELLQSLADDQDFARWALRTAEHRLVRTINRVEEAAEWLSGCLESELAAAIFSSDPAEPLSEVESRLLALVTKLDDYEQKLANFERRLEHEKLESLKELAYGASHEINNPLANIAARAQTLLEGEEDPERARKLSAIHRQAMRAHEMISDLMLFARPPRLDKKPLDLRLLVERIVEEQRDLAEEHDVHLACEIGDSSIDALADETQLGVALSALIKNSLEAVSEGGDVRIAVRKIEAGSEGLAEISVRDNGPGISDAVRQHIFDPFFSGREAGRGLGFGLSKCWRIVTDHGGQMVVNRPSAGGAEISILLPTAGLCPKKES
jgi:signal transduction histidine kinase